MKGDKLDAEEKEYLESYEAGEWDSVKDADFSQYQAAAKASLKKDKRINIRLSSRDLESLQRIATHEGIPYQTLIGSILHKYANGYFLAKH
jgi:predicted DNA binding CopG/RHH family protein